MELINGKNDEVSSKAGTVETSVKAKVLKMKSGDVSNKNNSTVGGTKKTTTIAHKKVSGSDVVPSSNDPGFEEF